MVFFLFLLPVRLNYFRTDKNDGKERDNSVPKCCSIKIVSEVTSSSADVVVYAPFASFFSCFYQPEKVHGSLRFGWFALSL